MPASIKEVAVEASRNRKDPVEAAVAVDRKRHPLLQVSYRRHL
jgi:hypothetical protein